jgi:hypothetical protein
VNNSTNNGASLHDEPQPTEPAREIGPVDNEPSEVDVKVDAALGDLVRCAYHDRWLRARLQIVEDHINTLRCELAQLRGDLAAAYCRMDDMEGLNDD